MVSRRQVIVLTYHGIDIKPNPKPVKFRRQLSDFRMDIESIFRFGYEVISFRDLQAVVERRAALRNDAVIITFDDGLNSQFDFAIPVLRDYGVKATFFITPKLMGTSWFATQDRIDEVARQDSYLFDFESHGYQHINMKDLSPSELAEEMRKARVSQQAVWPTTGHVLALPYGDVNTPEMQAAAKAAGFRVVRTALGGVVNLDTPGPDPNLYDIPSYLIHEISNVKALLSRRSDWPNSTPAIRRG